MVVITYNHGAFIEQALESILAQVDAPRIQLIVSDDSSSDDTWNRIHPYADRASPEMTIQLIRNPMKLGVSGNFISAMSHVRGRYYVILEGDDYWIDSRKLRRQYEVMTASPECGMCFTDYLVLEGEKRLTTPQGALRHDIDLGDLLRGLHPQTSTVMMRAPELTEADSKRCLQMMYLDRYMFFLALLEGRGIYVPGEGSVYRRHQGGVNSMVDHRLQVRRTLEMHLKIQERLDEIGLLEGEHPELYRLYRKMLLLDMQASAFGDFIKDVAALFSRHRFISKHVLREFQQHRNNAVIAV